MQAISKIVLGTVQFGTDYGINNTTGKPNQETINKILNTAYRSGIHTLDTAEAYGNAHEVIGRFHRDYPENIFSVITKLPHRINEDLNQKIDKYLNELNVNKLHGLLFHSYQTYKDNKQSMELLNTYKNNGKVEYLGVSVYTNEQIEDVIEDQYVDIIQIPFNLFDNSNLRREVLNKAKSKGKIIHTRSAFLQGLFFMPLNTENRVVQLLAKELNYIRGLSLNSDIHLNKIALNYCLQQANIDNILIGIDNLDQLNQNLADADCSLPDELIAEINSIHIKDIDLLNPSLWNQ